MSSTHSEPELPEYPFTEPQRRYLRIINETTPLSDIVRNQPSLPSLPPLRQIRRRYLNSYLNSSLPSISESVDESAYSAVTDEFEEAHVARAQSIEIPERVTEHSAATITPPKVKTHTKIYSGLARLASKSSTNLAELSSATKEKFKRFKLTRSGSTYDLPGLLSPSPSPSPSVTPPLPPLPTNVLQTAARSSVPVTQSEDASSTNSLEPLSIKSPSRWTKARLSLRASMSRLRSEKN